MVSCCGTQSGEKEEMVRISSSQSGPPGNGVVRELRGACGALPAATCSKILAAGVAAGPGMDLEGSGQRQPGSRWPASLVPEARRPPNRPAHGLPDPMMESTSHEIGSSGKGVRDQFGHKKPQAWHHPADKTLSSSPQDGARRPKRKSGLFFFTARERGRGR